MDNSKYIVLSQKEEFISIQRVKENICLLLKRNGTCL